MSRRRWYAGAGARTQQTGIVLALAMQPTTFQRTLMPRSTLDQALTTGICGALDLGFAARLKANHPDKVDVAETGHAEQRKT